MTDISNKMQPVVKKVVWLALFSAAMGFMETAIVVYLRKLYYPHGFQFPLTPIDTGIAVIEVCREAATIIMLVAIGILSGKNATQRFAFFLFCFGIWDICYYVFLKLCIGWPASLLTWDILFLIPIPWVGPVLAPCIMSATMMAFTLTVVWLQQKGYTAQLKPKEWALMITGSIIIILSFVWDYISYTNHIHTSVWTPATKQPLFNEIAQYVPVYYNWWVFGLGELVIVYAILRFARRVYRRVKYNAIVRILA